MLQSYMVSIFIFFFHIFPNCESAQVVLFLKLTGCSTLFKFKSNFSCSAQLNAASFKTRHVVRILNRAEVRAASGTLPERVAAHLLVSQALPQLALISLGSPIAAVPGGIEL